MAYVSTSAYQRTNSQNKFKIQILKEKHKKRKRASKIFFQKKKKLKNLTKNGENDRERKREFRI